MEKENIMDYIKKHMQKEKVEEEKLNKEQKEYAEYIENLTQEDIDKEDEEQEKIRPKTLTDVAKNILNNEEE